MSFIGVIEVFRRRRSSTGATFNFTPYLGCALIFLIMTIPLARFVDWLGGARSQAPAGEIAR